MHKEMANPTGLLAEVVHKSIEPFRSDFISIVRELLGSNVPEREVMLCMGSIVAQCFSPGNRPHQRQMTGKASAGAACKYMQFSIEEIAQHITRFSLAGIREISHQWRKR